MIQIMMLYRFAMMGRIAAPDSVCRGSRFAGRQAPTFAKNR